ncbi:MAG: hypothetical protein ACREPY_00825, partial [Rhodanobacteraceae bacterium]
GLGVVRSSRLGVFRHAFDACVRRFRRCGGGEDDIGLRRRWQLGRGLLRLVRRQAFARLPRCARSGASLAPATPAAAAPAAAVSAAA